MQQVKRTEVLVTAKRAIFANKSDRFPISEGIKRPLKLFPAEEIRTISQKYPKIRLTRRPLTSCDRFVPSRFAALILPHYPDIKCGVKLR